MRNDIFECDGYDATRLAAVAVRLNGGVWGIVPPVGGDHRATSAGS